VCLSQTRRLLPCGPTFTVSGASYYIVHRLVIYCSGFFRVLLIFGLGAALRNSTTQAKPNAKRESNWGQTCGHQVRGQCEEREGQNGRSEIVAVTSRSQTRTEYAWNDSERTKASETRGETTDQSEQFSRSRANQSTLVSP
jgi:YD repeat-containing protein